MKVRTRPAEAEAVQWEGQLVGDDAIAAAPDVDTPNGIEYLTDVIGTDAVRLSGHGLRVLTEHGWAEVEVGDYIVLSDEGTILTVTAAQFQTSYEVTS